MRRSEIQLLVIAFIMILFTGLRPVQAEIHGPAFTPQATGLNIPGYRTFHFGALTHKLTPNETRMIRTQRELEAFFSDTGNPNEVLAQKNLIQNIDFNKEVIVILAADPGEKNCGHRNIKSLDRMPGGQINVTIQILNIPNCNSGLKTLTPKNEDLILAVPRPVSKVGAVYWAPK